MNRISYSIRLNLTTVYTNPVKIIAELSLINMRYSFNLKLKKKGNVLSRVCHLNSFNNELQYCTLSYQTMQQYTLLKGAQKVLKHINIF